MLKNNGFTIIELIVVIIILGTLASMVIPAYTGIMNQSTIYDASPIMIIQ